MSSNKKLGRNELIDEIAKRAYIHRSVVDEVLKAFSDIAVDEIVNNGEFKIPELLTIEKKKWGKTGYTKRENPYRLVTRFSKSLLFLFRKSLDLPQNSIHKDNWRELRKDFNIQSNSNKKDNENIILSENGLKIWDQN